MSDPILSATTDKERLKIVVDIWKHAVGVQMHFNDIEMKIRTLYFTILAAAMALIGAVQDKRAQMPAPKITIDIALFVLVAIIPITMLFYFLDKHWYHRLLVGAVNHCRDIESKYSKVLPEIQLGTTISKESPVAFTGRWKKVFWFIKDERFRELETSELHSDAKIEVLYKSVIWGITLVIFVYALFGGIQFKDHSAISILIAWLWKLWS